MATLELQSLRKSLPGAPDAVAGVDLRADDGELLVILGPSGSGKTTTLRLIAGLETPDAGKVMLDGRDVSRVGPRDRDVAMVFTGDALYPHLTVRGNLEFPLRSRGMGRVDRDARLRETAGPLGIVELLARFPGELSDGQRKRVALGRALVRRPAVFLLDEPLSNLDAPLRVALRDLLAGVLRRAGTATVLVTHDQDDALFLADRIAVMDRGRIRQIGTPTEIHDRPADVFVAGFVGSPAMNFLPRGDITVGVRPADLRECGEGEAEFVGIVRAVRRIGSCVRVELRVADREWIWTPTEAPACVVGSTVHLRAAEERRQRFDAKTGTRMEGS